MLMLLEKYVNEDMRPKEASKTTPTSTPTVSSTEGKAANGVSYIVNATRGHDEGDSFSMVHQNPDVFVTQIGWYSRRADGYTVLKAIEVEWSDGNRLSIGEHYGNPDNIITFSQRSKISRCNLRAGTWVDGMDFWVVTEIPSQTIGNSSGGTTYPQDIGNGRLVGFHGKKGEAIGMLGLIFGKK